MVKRVAAVLITFFALVAAAVAVPTTAQAYMFDGTKGWRLTVAPGDSAVGFALKTPGYWTMTTRTTT